MPKRTTIVLSDNCFILKIDSHEFCTNDHTEILNVRRNDSCKVTTATLIENCTLTTASHMCLPQWAALKLPYNTIIFIEYRYWIHCVVVIVLVASFMANNDVLFFATFTWAMRRCDLTIDCIYLIWLWILLDLRPFVCTNAFTNNLSPQKNLYQGSSNTLNIKQWGIYLCIGPYVAHITIYVPSAETPSDFLRFVVAFLIV